MTQSSRADRPRAGTDPSRVSFDRLSIVGAALTFTVLGAVESVYGPLLQAIHGRFDVSVPVAGITLTVHFIGVLVGVVAAMFLVRRIQGRWLMTGASLLVACGCGAIALARSWPEFACGVAVTGVGFGILDLLLNQLLSRTSARGRATRLTALNGMFGFGALVGPLLVDWLTPRRFSTLFGAFAVAALVITLTPRGLVAAPIGSAVANEDRRSGWREHAIARALGVERRSLLVGFLLGFVVYVAVETSVSGWIAVHLHAVGYPTSVGALVTAGFWGGMTVGRFAASWLGRFVSERVFVLGGLALALALSLAARSAAVAPDLYPMIGLMLAPVFPMALSWYTKLEPSSAHGVSLLVVGSAVGGMIGPATQSLAVSNLGLGVVPTVTALLAFVDFCVFAGLVIRKVRPSERAGLVSQRPCGGRSRADRAMLESGL
ncbi:MAG: MFS transporter [Acidimicrobiales bacterium]